ncbi:MAG: DUF3303 family protein [Fimbriimonadaceae bacterium]|nr:DUF3303 family protein [Fimbriimonadaceae bacterium]
MLFMVIERFKNGQSEPVGERFQRQGRMFPEGVEYVSSWIDPVEMRCFQVMQAPSIELLRQWTARWDDLVDFEIVRVVTSQEFWNKAPQPPATHS